MKITNYEKGTIERSNNYKERYTEAIIDNWHNHLRISRILCCLNNTGFRLYAI